MEINDAFGLAAMYFVYKKSPLLYGSFLCTTTYGSFLCAKPPIYVGPSYVKPFYIIICLHLFFMCQASYIYGPILHQTILHNYMSSSYYTDYCVVLLLYVRWSLYIYTTLYILLWAILCTVIIVGSYSCT